MSEKWPFLETTEFNPFLETSRELVSSRAVSSRWQGYLQVDLYYNYIMMMPYYLGQLWTHLIIKSVDKKRAI